MNKAFIVSLISTLVISSTYGQVVGSGNGGPGESIQTKHKKNMKLCNSLLIESINIHQDLKNKSSIKTFETKEYKDFIYFLETELIINIISNDKNFDFIKIPFCGIESKSNKDKKSNYIKLIQSLSDLKSNHCSNFFADSESLSDENIQQFIQRLEIMESMNED